MIELIKYMTFENLKSNLEDNLNQLDGEVSLYVKLLNSGEIFSLNESHQFWAASVIKIPLVVEFFRQVKTGAHDLKKRVVIKPENIVKGSGVVHLLDAGNAYTTGDLVKLAMILSDNAATNEVIDLVGWENVEKHMKELGLESTTFRHKMMIKAGRGPNLITTKDVSLLLEKLFEDELPYSKDILDILSEEKLRDRIPKYIPNDIKISHKTGSLSEAVHDVGIVFSDNPFIFCFLTDNQKNKELTKETVGKCAKLCFDYVQNAK